MSSPSHMKPAICSMSSSLKKDASQGSVTALFMHFQLTDDHDWLVLQQ